jgi:ribosomal protein S18 acetylase RimI-like enzyme
LANEAGIAPARTLPRAARSEPWLEGIIELALEVTPDNVRARNFYERIGFRGANVSMQLRLVKMS